MRSTEATRSTGSGHSGTLLCPPQPLRDPAPAIDVGTDLDERQLDRGERGRDVEDVEPADVADAEDLSLQPTLAGCECDPVRVAQVAKKPVSVDPVGHACDRDDCRRIVVRREELEPHCLEPGACG